MRQYEVGETFIAEVERIAGPRGIDATWRSPKSCPPWRSSPDRATGSPTSTRSERHGERSSAARAHDLCLWWAAAGDRGLLRWRGLAPRCSRWRSTRSSCRSRSTSTTGCVTEDAAEAEVVAAVATRLGAEFRSGAASRSPRGPTWKAHAPRRALRPRSSRQASPSGASTVLVGHTADDQAEPVLLNVLRGAATTGLAGMAPTRDRIARPLLGWRRAGAAARAVRATRAARARRPDEPRRQVPAGGDPPRGHAAARTHRRARPHAGVGSPGRAAPRGDRVPRRRSRVAAWPGPEARRCGGPAAGAAAGPGPARVAQLAGRAAPVRPTSSQACASWPRAGARAVELAGGRAVPGTTRRPRASRGRFQRRLARG